MAGSQSANRLQRSAGGIVFRPPGPAPEGIVLLTSENVAGRDVFFGSSTRPPGARGPSDREEGESACRGRRGGGAASPANFAGAARAEHPEVALISVGRYQRWQLPKGTIEFGETWEEAALREVREETGLHAEVMESLGVIEYWYSAREHGHWIRFHKFVHFYLMRFLSGHVMHHDHEVNEARWFSIHEAVQCLAFGNERHLMERARDMLL